MPLCQIYQAWDWKLEIFRLLIPVKFPNAQLTQPKSICKLHASWFTVLSDLKLYLTFIMQAHEVKLLRNTPRPFVRCPFVRLPISVCFKSFSRTTRRNFLNFSKSQDVKIVMEPNILKNSYSIVFGLNWMLFKFYEKSTRVIYLNFYRLNQLKFLKLIRMTLIRKIL